MLFIMLLIKIILVVPSKSAGGYPKRWRSAVFRQMLLRISWYANTLLSILRYLGASHPSIQEALTNVHNYRYVYFLYDLSRQPCVSHDWVEMYVAKSDVCSKDKIMMMRVVSARFSDGSLENNNFPMVRWRTIPCCVPRARWKRSVLRTGTYRYVPVESSVLWGHSDMSGKESWITKLSGLIRPNSVSLAQTLLF